MMMYEDIILKGATPAGQISPVNYTVYPLKKPHEFSDEKPIVNKYSPKVFTSKTQFESPFAYSTASWQTSGGCDKNVTKFRRLQPLYRDQPQPVTVKIDKTENESIPFRYDLKNILFEFENIQRSSI